MSRITLCLTQEQEETLTLIMERREYPSLASVCHRAIEYYLSSYRPKRNKHGSKELDQLNEYFKRFMRPTPEFLKLIIERERQEREKLILKKK